MRSRGRLWWGDLASFSVISSLAVRPGLIDWKSLLVAIDAEQGLRIVEFEVIADSFQSSMKILNVCFEVIRVSVRDKLASFAEPLACMQAN